MSDLLITATEKDPFWVDTKNVVLVDTRRNMLCLEKEGWLPVSPAQSTKLAQLLRTDFPCASANGVVIRSDKILAVVRPVAGQPDALGHVITENYPIPYDAQTIANLRQQVSDVPNFLELGEQRLRYDAIDEVEALAGFIGSNAPELRVVLKNGVRVRLNQKEALLLEEMANREPPEPIGEPCDPLNTKERIARMEKALAEAGVDGVKLKMVAPGVYEIRQKGVLIGTVTSLDDKIVRTKIEESRTPRDPDTWKGDNYYKIRAYAEHGQVLNDENIKELKGFALEEQRKQIADPATRPKTLQSIRGKTVPKPESLHGIAVRGLRDFGRHRDTLKPLNYEAITRALNEAQVSSPEDRTRLMAQAKDILNFNPVNGVITVSAWIRNEAKKSSERNAANKDAAEELLQTHEAVDKAPEEPERPLRDVKTHP